MLRQIQAVLNLAQRPFFGVPKIERFSREISDRHISFKITDCNGEIDTRVTFLPVRRLMKDQVVRSQKLLLALIAANNRPRYFRLFVRRFMLEQFGRRFHIHAAFLADGFVSRHVARQTVLASEIFVALRTAEL